MKPLWTGTISFGLINIPVNLYSASSSRGVDLDMLRKGDLCPIHYARVCRLTGEEVPYDQIVKGYEYTKGDYVVLEPREIKDLDAKKTSTLDITQFVQESDVDTKFYEKPYFLEPGRGGQKAYALLVKTLQKTGRVAIAKYVFRTKEDIGVIKSDGKMLILVQMRYADEIKNPEGLEIPQNVHISKEEEEMAVHLVQKLTAKFNPQKFHDTFTQELNTLIEKKAHGKKFKVAATVPKPTSTADIFAKLKASLQDPHDGHSPHVKHAYVN